MKKINQYLFIVLILLLSCQKEDQILSPDRTINLEGKYVDLCTNENNEIIMIGTNDDFDPPYGNCDDFVIVKTDQDGNLIWTAEITALMFISLN
jgi:hypothetical protein